MLRIGSLRDANRRVVAVVTIAVLAAACAFAFAVGQLKLFRGGYEMSGVFTDTGGLKRNDDVRVAGVKVGQITSVRPDFGQGHIVITWTVDDGIDLGRATHADVATSTLLGGRYLRLSGPVGRPYMADLPADRRRIPLVRTSVPFTVTDAIEGATRITGSLDQKAINKLLDETTKIKTPSSQKLHQMLQNFRVLSTTLNDEYPDIQRLIANSKTVTGTLAAKDAELVRIVNSSEILLRALVRRRNELAATIGQSNQTVRTLTTVISRNQRELNTLLDDLHLLTTRLQPNMDALNTDFALLGPTFSQLANIRGNGPWLEGMITGVGPLQPFGPNATPKQGGP
ncbi:MAG TPA: MlaD family protein [Streptosporangiaceae bacterium]|jgi:phospholipid/cholesterol/gamma-HCH transport system substrate-binding protein